MRNWKLRMACAWMTATTAALSAGVRAAAVDNRILFIGNSLTASYDMPAMVGQIRAVSGNGPSDYYQQSATTFGVGLDYHWSDYSAQGAHRKLELGGWDG